METTNFACVLDIIGREISIRTVRLLKAEEDRRVLDEHLKTFNAGFPQVLANVLEQAVVTVRTLTAEVEALATYRDQLGICPICRGTGKHISYIQYDNSQVVHPCDGCGGHGYLKSIVEHA